MPNNAPSSRHTQRAEAVDECPEINEMHSLRPSGLASGQQVRGHALWMHVYGDFVKDLCPQLLTWMLLFRLLVSKMALWRAESGSTGL